MDSKLLEITGRIITDMENQNISYTALPRSLYGIIGIYGYNLPVSRYFLKIIDNHQKSNPHEAILSAFRDQVLYLFVCLTVRYHWTARKCL